MAIMKRKLISSRSLQEFAVQVPDCLVWLPRDEPVRLEAPAVLVSSYAFGGANLSAVLTGAGDA